jgi:hypothetical protein
MNFKYITMASAAALTLMIAAPNTLAQEGGDKTPPKTDRERTDRPVEADKGDRKEGEAMDADKKATLKLVQKAMREEKKHRETLAKIARLQEVFTEKGDKEQLAKLDGAVERENKRYQTGMQQAKEKMGAETFAKVAAMMDSGKERMTKKAGKGKEEGRTTDRARGDKPGAKDAEGRTTDRARGDKPAEGRTTDRARGDKPADKDAEGRTTDRARGDKPADKGGTDRKREDAKGTDRTNG